MGEAKWKDAGGGVQLFILIALWYLGVVLSTSFSHLILGDISGSAVNIRLSNAIGSIFLFLLPVVIYNFLFVENYKYSFTEKKLKPDILLLAVLAILCFQPFVETIAFYNEMIKLPESMADVQKVLDDAEIASGNAMKLLFKDNTLIALLLNVLVLSVLPGLLEELFFRGCMQRSLFNISKNIHVAIWTTAFIFSLFHLQLAGLFPRILLGALLGYLYVWTKNIWIPIIMHAAHNASIVIIQQCLLDTDFYRQMKIEDYSFNGAGIFALISLSLTVVLLVIVWKRTRNNNQRIPL